MPEVVGTDPLGQYVSKRYAELQGNRVNWETHWEDVSRYVAPNKDDIWDNQTKGEHKTDHLFDSSAKRYSNELANALHSMLTNPTTRWFELTTGDRELDALKPVRAWLQESVQSMLRILNNSNFQEEIIETYHSLATFGTAPIRIEEDAQEMIRFYARPIYKCFIAQNNRKKIDFLIRKYKFTVRQIAMEFGLESLDRYMVDQLRDSPNTEYEIWHAVGPRADLQLAGLDDGSSPLPFFSLHVLSERKRVLNDPMSGFHEFPYACPRWMKIPGETYGRSPAMDVLPDVKTINAMKKVILQGAQLAVAPPLQMVDNSLVRPIKFRPFGINYRRPGSEPIQPIVTGADPRIGLDLLEEIKSAINEGFFIHQLRMAQADRMTATEVIQRRDEQLRSLGGILGRLQNELLAPLINRTFNILLRNGALRAPPEELAGAGSIDVKYTSMLAKAQIQGESENVQRALSVALPLMESQPQIMDNLDGDRMLRISFDTFGVDERFLRGEEEVAEMREAQAEQAAAEQEQMVQGQDAQAAGQMAPLMKEARAGTV